MASGEEFMLPCLNKKFLGLDCMGCGTQRAISLILEGEFIAAFKMYPAIYTLLIMLAFIAVNFFKHKKTYTRIIIYLAIINAVIIITNFIIKTIN